MSLAKNVYNVLWGSSEVPENRSITFLLSNLSYIIFGILLILKKTNDIYDNDRITRAWILLLIGFVSTVFHSNQVAHGQNDHRTGIFHLMDISFAILGFVFAVFIRGIDNIPALAYILVLSSLPFYLYNGRYYWLAHSIWHLLSATVLFVILDY